MRARVERFPVMTSEDSVDLSFDAIYERYHRLIRSVVFKMALREEVEDLVQEAFLKIWRGRRACRTTEDLKRWVCRVALNVGRDAWRKRKRTPASQPLPESLGAPEDRRPEDQQLLLRGLAELKPKHREVLVLHCLEDMPLAEIADLLLLAEGTVKSRLHYAKAALAAYLNSQGGAL